MWETLLIAFALLLVIEGIAPFINPGGVRRLLLMVNKMDDMTLRIAGLVSMLLGLTLLYIVH